MWGSEFFFERRCCTTRGDGGGAQAIVRGGARCVSQVALAVSRGAARWSSQVLDRGAHDTMPMPEVPRVYLIVVYRPFPAAPLVVRCMYMAVLSTQVLAVGLRLRLVVPRPMPAADVWQHA